MLRRHPFFSGKTRFWTHTWNPAWFSLILAGVLLVVFVSALNVKMKPILSAMAVTRVSNTVTAVVNDAVLEGLASEQISYDDMMILEAGADGGVTILSSDLSRANLLRSKLLSLVLDAVSELSEESFSIPLGNLTEIGFLSGRGPTIGFEILSTGAANATFEHEFTSAGVNQTLHRIMLDIEVTVQVLLPGQTVELPVSTQVCVAETIIIGEVPGTYLELEQ